MAITVQQHRYLIRQRMLDESGVLEEMRLVDKSKENIEITADSERYSRTYNARDVDELCKYLRFPTNYEDEKSLFKSLIFDPHFDDTEKLDWLVVKVELCRSPYRFYIELLKA